MAQRKPSDPIVAEIEHALMPGQCVRDGAMYESVRGLGKLEAKLETLVQGDETERALRLYELFLAGCYEKIEECDDSGAQLSMFFDGLFCG